MEDSQYSRILVVDSSDDREVTTTALRFDGWHVVEAETFDRALPQLRSVAIHAIVIDPFNIESGRPRSDHRHPPPDQRADPRHHQLYRSHDAGRRAAPRCRRLRAQTRVAVRNRGACRGAGPPDEAGRSTLTDRRRTSGHRRRGEAGLCRRRRDASAESRVRPAGAARAARGHGLRSQRDLRTRVVARATTRTAPRSWSIMSAAFAAQSRAIRATLASSRRCNAAVTDSTWARSSLRDAAPR